MPEQEKSLLGTLEAWWHPVATVALLLGIILPEESKWREVSISTLLFSLCFLCLLGGFISKRDQNSENLLKDLSDRVAKLEGNKEKPMVVQAGSVFITEEVKSELVSAEKWKKKIDG